VFAPALHGTDEGGGDRDLLVEPSKPTILLDQIGTRVDMEDLPGVMIDVLAPSAPPSNFPDKVLRKAQPLQSERVSDYLENIADATDRRANRKAGEQPRAGVG
jgi:hypothetical protein